MDQGTTDRSSRPAALDARRQQLHKLVDHVADFCESYDGSFFAFEKKIKKHVWALARLLLGLFLLAAHLRLQEQDKRYPAYRLFSGLVRRTLRTMFGKVRYKRAYWVKRKGGGGFHPLDAELGLTRDGFSPWVISLACRLSTYLSYAKTNLLMEQGQLQLSCCPRKDLQQEVFVPTTSASRHGNAVLAGVLLEQR